MDNTDHKRDYDKGLHVSLISASALVLFFEACLPYFDR